MVSSMTGFGRAFTDTDAGQLSVTIRSINSRYLDLKIRGLNFEPEVEKSIRDLITKRLIRGTVGITFELNNNSTFRKNLSFNKDRFEALDNILKTIGAHIAKHRTQDLKSILFNSKKDLLGRLYRLILEPICYIVGRIKLWQ